MVIIMAMVNMASTMVMANVMDMDIFLLFLSISSLPTKLFFLTKRSQNPIIFTIREERENIPPSAQLIPSFY